MHDAIALCGYGGAGTTIVDGDTSLADNLFFGTVTAPLWKAAPCSSTPRDNV